MKRLIGKIILKYLQILTRYYVRRNRIDIFGLTGSVGKTTLTLALHTVLSKKYRTGMTFREGHGLNSESGIPFALLDVHVDGYKPVDWFRYLFIATLHCFTKKTDYEKFIIEMGVDKPGDMDFILSMTKADLGIFLSIAKVHTENFERLLKEDKKDEEALLKLVMQEKAKVILALEKEGWAVLNYDEEMIRALRAFTKAHVITFGLKKGADVRGFVDKISLESFRGRIRYKQKEAVIEMKKYIVNSSTFHTLLAAITVGLTYTISLEDCIKAVEEMDFPPGRMSKIAGIKDTIIIDSSYNSSRLSLSEALDNLALFKDLKKIAVLGDMRELGSESKSEHEAVARKASKVADEFVLIGPAMKSFFAPELLRQNILKNRIHLFNNTWKALEFIKNTLIKGGEVILVKGSQNTLFLEIVVEGLMKNPKQADKLLCRRGQFWEKKRQELKHN